jgi:hypothetical protein
MATNYGTAPGYELENMRRSLGMVKPDAPSGLTALEAGQLIARVLADEAELRRLRDDG